MLRIRFLLITVIVTAASMAMHWTCSPACAQVRTRVGVEKVLVVVNTKSPDSTAIAASYIQKRKVPAGNVIRIECPTTETCTNAEFVEKIRTPIRAYLAAKGAGIDYILLNKGIPIRLSDGEQSGYAVDSLLAMLDWTLIKTRTPNPYFGKAERFSRKKYGIYLVTRLDGYTREDCLQLILRSLAARPVSGPFLLHTGPGHEDAGYKFVNDGMRSAYSLLKAKGKNTILSTGDTFAGGYKSLMGYFSWGSNDGRYDRKAYNTLGFVPGAIVETAVSTSARTLTNPNEPGQSLIGDLIAQGATGAKGYVSEPFADSIARADILFDRYTSGYNLAESFYMASAWCYWKDLVIGDPLCAPYAVVK